MVTVLELGTKLIKNLRRKMVTIVFLTMSILTFNATAIFIPKKMTKIEIYTTSLFALVLQLTSDAILDLKFDFYGYFNKGVDLKSFIVMFGIYPSASIIILNYFPFYKSIKAKILYIVIASGACLVFEWLSIMSGYFYYTVWKLWYSALCYPVLILIMACNLSHIRKMMKGK